MSVTFHGTITKDKGLLPAAGTVAITPDGGSTTTETLDATGTFSVALSVGGQRVTVLYTITGDPVATTRTKTLTAVDGASVDLGLDIGRTGAPLAEGTVPTPASHQSAVSAPAALTGAAISTTAAVDLTTSEALANALKAAYNLTAADVVTLQAELATLTTAVNALNTALQAAGLES